MNSRVLVRVRVRTCNTNALTHQLVIVKFGAMSYKALFTKIARALKEKLSTTIQEILTQSSFDSEASILGINIEIIKDIEAFVNDNKHILIGTEYAYVLQTNSVFKFKPGHRSVFILLPKKLQEYNNTKKI